jgi:putative transposase
MDYRTKNHSKYLIKLHFVFVVKYRKKLLVGNLKEDMSNVIIEICEEKSYRVIAIESDVNHLHILVDIDPKVSAFEIAHQLKQISTNRIYKKYKSFLRSHFWKKNIFWSSGYFVCSIGDASTETIKKYIENQG